MTVPDNQGMHYTFISKSYEKSNVDFQPESCLVSINFSRAGL